jgi:hypothetical protein
MLGRKCLTAERERLMTFLRLDNGLSLQHVADLGEGEYLGQSASGFVPVCPCAWTLDPAAFVACRISIRGQLLVERMTS